MARKLKRVLTLILVVAMCMSTMAVTVHAEEAEAAPQLTVKLTPGKTTDSSEKVFDGAGNAVYRIVAQTGEVETTTSQTASEFKAPQSVLKFDRNDSADQKVQQKIRDLYTDNGHFTDPDSITVTGAPEGYPFQYVGTGDYSGHYVSKIRVVYDKDEAGNALKDADGNYIIKELQHSNGTPLTIDLQSTKSFEGPYDQTTGTRPIQFLLKTEAGDTVYAYCIDVETGTASGNPWYAVANLEDNDYYASQEAEDHVRGIVFNGYWGTAEGTGSLAQLKAALKAALAEGKVDADYDIHFRNRKANNGEELAANQYASANYIYTKLNQQVTLTDEIIDGLTEGEALDAMQSAIWSWANGSTATLDGTDRMIVGDLSYASSAMGDSRNGANDFEGAARTRALYSWLMQQTASADSVVLNDATFAEDITLTVSNGNYGVYDAAIKFTIPGYEANSKDDLKVALTYLDGSGNPVTIEKSLTGKDAIEADANGYFTFDGIKLAENNPFDFTLNIYGKQYLEKNAYIYTAQNGTDASQTMVGMAEGYVTVDVTKKMTSEFSVSKSFEVTPNVPEELGTKKDELIDREENRYNVTIDVPGRDGDTRHDEVILMVDGSYSMDNEWPAMKEAINTIGASVLNGSGTTQLTLMAFGMGDNEVLVHVKDAEELAAALGELPGNLLYGRSSTNCEAGFDGVANYIKNHDSSLKDVSVIFISDGNVNTDETPRAFDANWKTWTKFGALTVAQTAFEETVLYGEKLPEAFKTVFGNRFDGLEGEALLAKAFGGEVTDEEFIAFAEQLWTDVYNYSGLARGFAYPVSVAERAFVKYDKENGTYIQDLFYYTTYQSSYVTYGDRWTRTPVAADELAAMPQVASMYVVDYDGYTSWMDTGIKSEKSTFVKSEGIAGLCEALSGALNELAKTPFNDVYVTDYMSKWVNLDADTLKIIDNTTGEVIWTAKDGWKITENIPTAQNPPVKVELVAAEDYANGGEDVLGNTSGDIYKLTWYVKDGAMLRSDNYRLSYEVTVDTNESGFEYDKDYPANGTTELNYKDENGKDQKNDIDVPDVNAPAPKITEIVVQKVDDNGKALAGAKFALYAVTEAGETLVGEYEVGANGEFSVAGLKAGSYKLVETVTPNGYIGVEGPMYFDIVEAGEELTVKQTFGEFELEFPATAYEISNHITSIAIPQTFVLLDAEDAGSWTYSEEYAFGESDYRVVYCGDSTTGAEDGTRYVKTALEDCFNAATANKLRAIIANSYPYVSMEEMIAAAQAANVADAENLTRGDLIAAVQLAIWHYTNGTDYEYKSTYSVKDYPRWGKVFNDYSDELPEGLPNGTTDKIVDEASDARVRALYNYLLGLDPMTAAASKINTYFYTAVGGKDISQSLIGGDRTDFYTEGLKIYVKNFSEKKPDPEIDKTTTELYEEKYADVTLSVNGLVTPSAETSSAVDVVLALGAGIAKEQNTYDSIVTLVKPLIDEGINVKLGLVAVEHYDDVAMELTALTKSNYEDVITKGLAAIKAMPAGPTNLHGNIVAAKAMLDADKAVPASNKFFYVIGTGRTYNFDNEAGVPTTIVNKVALKGSTYYYWGHYLWQSQRGRHTSLYMIPDRYNNDFAAYWADVEKWVKADGNKYAYSFTDAYNTENPQWFNEFMNVNGTDAKAMGLASSRFGWILPGLTNTGLEAIGSDVDPQNALNYERAQYEAYYAYKAMVDAGYTCQALCSESTSYQNESPYIQVQKYTGTSKLQLGHSFMNHLAKASGQEKAPILFVMTDPNTGAYEMAKNFFAPIDMTKLEKTEKAPAAVPFVEDFIGFGDDYDFDFTGKKIVLNLNGVDYATTEVAAENGADATYAFAASEGAKPAFKLDYFKGNGTTEERFVWYFLTKLTEKDNVTLTYQLELVKRSEVAGTHIADTNQSATLYPEGDRDHGMLFPVPKVEYTVEEKPEIPTITFKKGEASNISFMLIDKATGAVEFLNKVDIKGETSFEIPAEEGKISAVFVKQSTSGMFWFAEAVDEATQQAVINCLKKNNPSYKGHNAIAFGAGEHELEFKKGKFATYTFAGCEVVEIETAIPEAPKPEEPKVEAPKPEEPKVEAPKPEAPKPEAPKAEAELKVKVKGAEVASWTVDGDITAIYIAAEGKVPAVIWVSAEVDEETLSALIEALGAEDGATVVFGAGAHKIEYQHNKNKTKTVTYTFEIKK